MFSNKITVNLAAVALVLVLSGCKSEKEPTADPAFRTATAKTAVSTAEVTTSLPAVALSDERLQGIANSAADGAARMPSAGEGPEGLDARMIAPVPSSTPSAEQPAVNKNP